MKKNLINNFLNMLLVSIFCLSSFSCEKDEDNDAPKVSETHLKLSIVSTNITLIQKDFKNNISFTWTSGSNQGTGASINYYLQIDKKGNKFSKAMKFDLGKGTFQKDIAIETINDSLLYKWEISPYTQAQMESRIIAVVNSSLVKADTSALSSFSITPYLPVTKELYIVGDATPNGWSITAATQLKADSDSPWIFTYQGALKEGNFKFPVNRNSNWGQDMYMRDTTSTDSTKIYLHKGGSPDDKQWHISKPGLYKTVLNLLDKTISFTFLGASSYDTLYMFGDATPNGWSVDNATPMLKNVKNIFKFSYNGMLTVGDFKIPISRTGGFGQDMFMRDPSDSGKVYLHKGGDSDDSKWRIYKNNWYQVKLDISEKTISIKPLSLYMVGDATSAGWSIDKAVQLDQDATNPYIFTYTGAMLKGDLKFPVNRDSSWGQDMYMKTDDSHVYLHNGGDSDDNKFSITDAGTYKITVNVKDLTISIVKQ